MFGVDRSHVLIVAVCVVLTTVPTAAVAQVDSIDAGVQSSTHVASATDPPGLTWNETLGGPNDDEIDAVTRSGDGGYVVAGSFDGNSVDVGQAWLVKVDSDGNVVWNRTFAAGKFREVIRTSDGGYLAVGFSEGGFGSGDAALAVKVASDGSREWSETFGEGENSEFLDAVQTGSGGYVLAGSSYLGPQNESSSSTASNGYFVKVDGGGTKQWERAYGLREGADGVTSIYRTDDGSYRFFGGLGFGVWQWFGVVESDGSLVENRSIIAPNNFSVTTGSVETETGYAVVGYSGASPFGGAHEVHLQTMRDDGTVTSNRTYGGELPNGRTGGLARTADGGYAVALERQYDLFGGGTTGAVMKIGSDGTKEWVEEYGPRNASGVTDVLATTDGDVVFVGSITENGDSDGWIAMTGSDGDSGGSQSVSEAIAGADGVIDTTDLQEAIQYWVSGQAVPGTDGKTIDTSKLQKVITLWVSGQHVGK